MGDVVYAIDATIAASMRRSEDPLNPESADLLCDALGGLCTALTTYKEKFRVLPPWDRIPPEMHPDFVESDSESDSSDDESDTESLLSGWGGRPAPAGKAPHTPEGGVPTVQDAKADVKEAWTALNQVTSAGATAGTSASARACLGKTAATPSAQTRRDGPRDGPTAGPPAASIALPVARAAPHRGNPNVRGAEEGRVYVSVKTLLEEGNTLLDIILECRGRLFAKGAIHQKDGEERVAFLRSAIISNRSDRVRFPRQVNGRQVWGSIASHFVARHGRQRDHRYPLVEDITSGSLYPVEDLFVLV